MPPIWLLLWSTPAPAGDGLLVRPWPGEDPRCQIHLESRCTPEEPWRPWFPGASELACDGATYPWIGDHPPYAYPRGLFACGAERDQLQPQLTDPAVPLHWRVVDGQGGVLTDFEDLAATRPGAVLEALGVDHPVGPEDRLPACLETQQCWSPLDLWAFLLDVRWDACRERPAEPMPELLPD